jgi:acyl-CoA reductase-like NAD-dependent aldehyde dehydrogenase
MKAHDGMYIDGAWRDADGRDTIDVVNPADEQVIGQVPAGTALDVDTAVRAARAALPGWAATPPAERAARLAALRDVLVARKDEIAGTVTAELGSPLKFSQAVHAGARDRGGGVHGLRELQRRRTPSRRRSATPSSTTSRSASSAPSPPGTTRSTRSSPRSPRPSRPAAPSY